MTVATTCLEKYAQVISMEMMNALKESAQRRGVSLDLEIALRLIAGMIEPELGQGNSLFNQIMRTKFDNDAAVAESKRNRQDTLYVYEMEKLRMWLSFQDKLPRDFKETFTLIDVKAATKLIKGEQNV